jgi:hypothetical protein
MTYATIRRRSQSFSIPFLDLDVELFMRNYIAVTDSTFRGQLSTFTLGQWLAFFQKHSLRTTSLLDRLGLNYDRLYRAINRVNKEKDVKHIGSKTFSQATDFRAAFLGVDSVLAVLFPPA